MAANEVKIKVTLDDQASAKAKGLGGKMGGILKVGALAGGAALIGAGIAAFKFGQDFEKAFNIIKIGTGASGEDLKALEGNFKTVFSSIPVSMDDAAMAVADLNTLTGATGKGLEDLAITALQAADVMGVDGAALIDNFGKTMKIFGTPVAEGSALLDQLFVVSQRTGIGIDQLQSEMQTFGPILANMGFSAGESAAFLGQLNAAGIDATRVMPALNKFARDAAAEGITDLGGALNDTINEIKNAKTDTEALNIATAAFGAEGAQRMTNGIREGNVALEDLDGLLADSAGSISNAEEGTRTLGEKFGLLKNKILTELEPAMSKMIDGLQVAADWLVDKLPGAIEKTKEKWDEMRPAVELVGEVLQTLGEFVKDKLLPPMIEFFDFLRNNKEILVAAAITIGLLLVPAFIAWAIAAGTAAVATVIATAPIIAIGLVIGLLVFGIIKLVQHWGEITDFMMGALKTALEFVGDKFNWVKDQIVEKFGLVLDFLKEHAPLIAAIILSMFLGPLPLIVLAIIKFRTQIVDKFKAIPGMLLDLGGKFLDAAKGLGGKLKDGLIAGFKKAGGIAGDIAGAVKDALIEVINTQIIDRINKGIPDKLGKGIFSIDLPDNPVPRLHLGGIVPGRAGEDVLTVLQAGERVLPIGQAGGGARGVGRGNTYVDTVIITGDPLEGLAALGLAGVA